MRTVLRLLRDRPLIPLSILFAVALAAPTYAQSTRVDRLVPALPTQAERSFAAAASWGALLGAVALDVHATWKAHCEGSWDECEGTIVKSALRGGVVFGSTFLLKKMVARTRPCAPDCGGSNPNYSFPSGHAALAFLTLGGPRLAFALPLAVGAGGLRVAANKHYLTDVLAGAAIGTLASRIR